MTDFFESEGYSELLKKRAARSAAVCTHSGKVTAFQKESSYCTLDREDNPENRKSRKVFFFIVRIRGPPSCVCFQNYESYGG